MRARLAVLIAIGLLAALVACLPSCTPAEDEPIDCTAENLCEDVNQRYTSDIDAIVESMNSCETRDDCTSAIPTLGCPEQATWLTTCAQGVRADSVDAFHAEVDGLGPTYCGDCDLECHHDDEFACTAPIAKCIEGRCVVEFAEDVQ